MDGPRGGHFVGTSPPTHHLGPRQLKKNQIKNFFDSPGTNGCRIYRGYK